MVHFKGSQVEFSKFWRFSVTESCFNLHKQCRPGSSLFAKVPTYGFPVYKGLEDLFSNDTLYVLKFYGYFYNSDNDKR